MMPQAVGRAVDDVAARDLHPERRAAGPCSSRSVDRRSSPSCQVSPSEVAESPLPWPTAARRAAWAGSKRSADRSSAISVIAPRWWSRRGERGCRASAGSRSRGAGRRCRASWARRDRWRRRRSAPCRRAVGRPRGVGERAAPPARVDALVPDVLERDAPVAGVGRVELEHQRLAAARAGRCRSCRGCRAWCRPSRARAASAVTQHVGLVEQFGLDGAVQRGELDDRPGHAR